MIGSRVLGVCIGWGAIALLATGCSSIIGIGDISPASDASVGDDTTMTTEAGGDDAQPPLDGTTGPEASGETGPGVDDGGPESGPDGGDSGPIPCSGASTQVCGNCGTQTRTCDTTTGTWSAWSACMGQGVCAPNATQSCGSGGTQSCTSSCAWGACGNLPCTGAASQACGNCGTQTRTCDHSTGMWSAWTACSGEGVCTPNATQSCGSGGTESCGGNCQWSSCTNQKCSGAASQSCGNCGTQTRTCDSTTGMWSAWSACTGQGVCTPGNSQSCQNNGTETCGGNCQWSSCGNQTCSGASSQACGNCGTQTRTCDSTTGMWSAWSTCSGQGVCAPGNTQSCQNSGTETCTSSCQWGSCGNQTCPGASSQPCGNCGNQTRTCDPNTGLWSSWSACTCSATGTTQTCNSYGQQSCSSSTSCTWATCSCPSAPVCTPGAKQCSGAAAVQTCNSCGQWGTAAACPAGDVCQGSGSCVWTPVVLDDAHELALWLEASSSNIVLSSGTVGVWKDLSSNHNDASTTSTGPSVDTAVVNGHDAVHFTDKGITLTANDAASLQFGTDQVFIEAVAKGPSGKGWFFSKATTAVGGAGVYYVSGLEFFTSSGTNDAGASIFPGAKVDSSYEVDWPGAQWVDGAFHRVAMRRVNASTLSVAVDDNAPFELSTSLANVSQSGQSVNIGGVVYGNFHYAVDLDIAEMLVVHSSTGIVADADVANVQAYLKNKYGL